MKPTLAKRIACEGMRRSQNPADQEWCDMVTSVIHGVLRKSPIIEISEVDKMFQRMAEDRSLGTEGKPISRWKTLSPPFSTFWMEYYGEWADDRIGRHDRGWTGIAFISVDINESQDPRELVRHMVAGRGQAVVDQAMANYDREKPRWLVTAMPVLARVGDPLFVPMFGFHYSIGEDGSLGGNVMSVSYMPSVRGAVQQTMDRDSLMMYTMGPAFEALQLLHCKNIGMKEHSLDRDEEKRFSKRFGERNGGYRFHTLVVRPMGERGAESPLSSVLNDGVLPLHVVRGHYKRYGEAWGTKPLFGKFEGQFFWHSFARGDEKNGVVDKDYAVAAPRTELQ